MYVISCAFHLGLHYLYGIWFDVLCTSFHSCHCRRIFLLALLTPLWDPLLGTGDVQGDDAPTRL